jgi:DNA-directed RNA polymerase specialized sigma24 family protein
MSEVLHGTSMTPSRSSDPGGGAELDGAIIDREPDLIAAAAAGDLDAWSHLVDSHLSAVWATARAFGLPDEAAENVCELVWLRLAQRLGDAPTPLRPWLLSIVESDASRWHSQQADAANNVVVLDSVPAAG